MRPLSKVSYPDIGIHKAADCTMISTVLGLLLAVAPQAAPAPLPPAPSSPAAAQPANPTPNAVTPKGADNAADMGYLSAGALVDRCSEASSASTSYCFAYIAGVSDAMKAYEIWLNAREFCPPAGQSQSDLRRAFVGFVSAYPSNRTGQAASVVVVSLKQTYPCESEPSSAVPPAPKP